MKDLVQAARQIQDERFRKIPGIYANDQMQIQQIKEYCILEGEAHQAFVEFNETFDFSARSYTKILSVAKTFADLERSEKIRRQDLVSAIMGRDLERENR